MHIISAEELAGCLNRKMLVEALRVGFQDGATVPTRHHHTIQRERDDATLLLMPAWSPGGHMGIKVVTVFPSNATLSLPSIYGTYTLLNGNTGAPLAIMDGRILTLFRTAATSVLAASYLARTGASQLLMVGTGALSSHIISTYLTLPGITEVKVWGRSYEKAVAIASQYTGTDVPVSACISLEEATAWADIISCATLSKTPLIKGAWLRAGAFVDLIGGYTPFMRESDDETIQRASIFVDTKTGALSEAGDILIPLQNNLINKEDILADLFDLTRGVHPGRRSEEEITLFKSVGNALEDLVAARLAYEALIG